MPQPFDRDREKEQLEKPNVIKHRLKICRKAYNGIMEKRTSRSNNIDSSLSHSTVHNNKNQFWLFEPFHLRKMIALCYLHSHSHKFETFVVFLRCLARLLI